MYPLALAAGLTALYFMAAVIQRPRPAEILAASLWAAFAVYEYHVANGTLCDANCNIRVDLVLFIPILASATYLALQEAPRTGTVTVLYVICLGMVAWLSAIFGYKAVAAIAGVGALIAAVVGFRLMLTNNRA